MYVPGGRNKSQMWIRAVKKPSSSMEEGVKPGLFQVTLKTLAGFKFHYMVWEYSAKIAKANAIERLLCLEAEGL